MDQQKLSQELESGDCIVTVSHSLSTLPSHDPWKQFRTIYKTWRPLSSMFGDQYLPIPTWASCIMLTSLAPSPIAKVMGFSGDVFKRRTTWTQQSQLGFTSPCRTTEIPALSFKHPKTNDFMYKQGGFGLIDISNCFRTIFFSWAGCCGVMSHWAVTLAFCSGAIRQHSTAEQFLQTSMKSFSWPLKAKDKLAPSTTNPC